MEAKSYYGGTGGACSRGRLRALPEHSSVRIMNGVCHENKRTPYPLRHSFYRRYLRDSFLPLFSPLLRVPHYVTGLLDHSLSRKKRKMYLPSTSPDTVRPAQTDPDPVPASRQTQPVTAQGPADRRRPAMRHPQGIPVLPPDTPKETPGDEPCSNDKKGTYIVVGYI